MIIEVKNLNKYYNDLHVLKNISLEINSGEIISIVGASGAGKTTLLQILGTLDTPTLSKNDKNVSLILNYTSILTCICKTSKEFHEPRASRNIPVNSYDLNLSQASKRISSIEALNHLSCSKISSILRSETGQTAQMDEVVVLAVGS